MKYIFTEYRCYFDEDEDNFVVDQTLRYVDEEFDVPEKIEADQLINLVKKQNDLLDYENDQISVDWSCSPDYIEFYTKEEWKPLGRIELLIE